MLPLVLTAGLGIGLVSLLSDGALLVSAPWMLYAWAISQIVGVDDQRESVESADGCEDVGRIGPLAAAGFKQPLLPHAIQEGIEQQVLCVAREQTAPKFAEDTVVKAGVAQLEAESIFPVNATARGVGVPIRESLPRIERW